MIHGRVTAVPVIKLILQELSPTQPIILFPCQLIHIFQRKREKKKRDSEKEREKDEKKEKVDADIATSWRSKCVCSWCEVSEKT